MMISCSEGACGACDEDNSLYGDFPIDLGASCKKPRKASSSGSMSSISFDASCGSLFGEDMNKNNKSSSSNLCYSRWESFGDSNSNFNFGRFDRGDSAVSSSGNCNNNKFPSVIFISGVDAAPTTTQQSCMTSIKMPQRQQTSHIRKTPLRRVSSCGTLSFGESLEESKQGNEQLQTQHQHQQQGNIALSPRLAMVKSKEDISRQHRLWTTAGPEKSGGTVGLAIGTSCHTFAAYSLVGPSNHTFAAYSKGSSSSNQASGQTSNRTFARVSSHTFASFASSNNRSSTGIQSTSWKESMEEKRRLEDASSVASFSSDSSCGSSTLIHDANSDRQ